MKNLYLIILFLLGMHCFAQKQELKPEPCGTDILMSRFLNDNPEAKERIDLMNNLIAAKKDYLNKTTFQTITIPVVVYVIHGGNNSPENISDIQVNGQINALNTYFAPYQIKFCLATKSNNISLPLKNSQTDVQTTPGIIHINNPTATNHFDNPTGIAQLTESVHPLITKNEYLRIWVVKSINGPTSAIKGYATFPYASSFDGIVMEYDIFGDNSQCPNCNLDPENNQGRILAHEVGHYLGLYHTFYGECSGMDYTTCLTGGDLVCDTPPVKNPNYYCVMGTNSCNETPDLSDKIHNFMDYGPGSCANEFTEGQKVRMHHVFEFARHKLVSNDNLIYTGVCGFEQLISANFVTDNSAVCINSNVTFNTLQQPNTSYFWNFGDGATSSNPNPTHLYTSTSSSPYTVQLTVTKNGISAVTSQLIFVTNCVPIQNSNAYWYVGKSYGLSFATGVPVFDISFPKTQFAYRNQSFLNDDNGNLIFYNNSKKVWDKNHVQINSTNIAITNNNSPGGHDGQSSLVVPKPDDPTKNYIFTVGPDSFRYSMVNVNGTNASMGVIRQAITFPSNNSYLASSDGALKCVSMTAIKNCSGYWILAILEKASSKFIVTYSLSNASTNNLTFVSECEIPVSLHPDFTIVASPNGNKIFVYSAQSGFSNAFRSYLFDFDKVAGIVSSPTEIIVDFPSNNPTIYGITGSSFSPDSNLLYLLNSKTNAVVQYNINTSKISQSRIDVGSKQPMEVFRNMQIGPDNKIYFVKSSYNLTFENDINVIHAPNNIVTSTNPNAILYTENGPKLPFPVDELTATPYYDPYLPNILNARYESVYNPSNKISVYVSGTTCNTYKFFPNVCGASFIWEFKNLTTGVVVNTSTENTPSYSFSITGNYLITLKSNNNQFIASSTLSINAPVIPVILGSSTTCISIGNSLTNNSVALPQGASVIWSITGGTGTISGQNNKSDVEIDWDVLPGTISVTVTNAAGCSSTATRLITLNCDDVPVGGCIGNLLFTNTEVLPFAEYQVSNSIITNTNYIVSAGSDIQMTAGQSITFEPNTLIDTGSDFIALIQNCVAQKIVNQQRILEIEKESKEQYNLNIFPNPTKGFVTVSINDLKISSIIVNSIEGKTVYTRSNINDYSYDFTLENFPKGFYSVIVQTVDGQIIFGKIIKD